MPNGDWKSQIEAIHKKSTENKETLADMQLALTEIKLVTCGSKKLHLKGQGERLEAVEDYISKDKKQKWMIVGGAVVIWAGIKLFWSKIVGV